MTTHRPHRVGLRAIKTCWKGPDEALPPGSTPIRLAKRTPTLRPSGPGVVNDRLVLARAGPRP